MPKSPEMEKILDELSTSFFGRGRKEDCCPCCGSTKVAPEDFRDDFSRHEHSISKMCQECQDSVFVDR